MRQIVARICTHEQQQVVSVGLALMQNGSFFAAHDAFEEAFRAAAGDARELLRALAQVAASHHQLTLGRGRAAVRTWEKARARLAALGALSAEFGAAMGALHDRAGVDVEGPRFIDPSVLGPLEAFPAPSLDP